MYSLNMPKLVSVTDVELVAAAAVLEEVAVPVDIDTVVELLANAKLEATIPLEPDELDEVFAAEDEAMLDDEMDELEGGATDVLVEVGATEVLVGVKVEVRVVEVAAGGVYTEVLVVEVLVGV